MGGISSSALIIIIYLRIIEFLYCVDGCVQPHLAVQMDDTIVRMIHKHCRLFPIDYSC